MKGGCLCGALRYEISGKPLYMHHCHCQQCRRASGASFATTLVVRSADLTIELGAERLAAYESTPGKKRHFCGVCGSPIFNRYDDNQEMLYLRSGTLDDDPGLRPERHIHVASKAPWIEILDDLPQSRREEDLDY